LALGFFFQAPAANAQTYTREGACAPVTQERQVQTMEKLVFPKYFGSFIGVVPNQFVGADIRDGSVKLPQ
jgi:hypothetical protein